MKSFRNLSLSLSLLTYVISAVSGESASAATIDWSASGASTAWATGTNWVGGVAPANSLTTDIARFDQTSYSFQPNAGTTSIAGLEIGDGSTTTATLTLAGTSLSIGSSGITKFANAGTATISSAIVLGAAQTWANNSSTPLTVSGIVSGTSALTIGGSGAITMTGSNTFSGGLTVKSGTLNTGIGANLATEGAALGTGAITLGDSSGTSSATISFNTSKGPTFSNAITVAAGSTGVLTLAANGATATVSGNISLNHDLVLTNVGAGAITYSGTITGSRDIFVNTTSTGQVILAGNNQNTWTGNLYVTSGLFRISGETSTVKSLSSNNILYLASGATFQNNNNILTIAGLNDYNGGGGVVDNPATNGRDLTLGGSGSYSFSGNLINSTTGTLGLAVSLTGAGIQTLSGSSSYLGNTSINSGILNIRNSAALGSTTAGTTVSSGATLQVQGNISVGAEALTVSGTGVSGQTGALVNVSGSNTYGGLVTLGAAATISSDAGLLALSNTGTITGATRTLTLTGAGNGSVASVIGTTTGGLVKNGSGTWFLTGASTYTGTTTVNAGTLIVGVGGAGSLTSAVTVTAGTVGGSGSTTGAVTIGNGSGTQDSFIAPGNGGAGTFTTTSSLSLLSDAVYSFELNGTAASADKLVANGISINSSAVFSFTLVGDMSGLAVNQTFTIVDNTGAGSITGTFSNLVAGGVYNAGGGLTFNVSGGSGAYGNDLILTVATVPEPSTYLLLGLGAALLFWRRPRAAATR